MADNVAQENVFLLYNEQDDEPEAIVHALRERGISIYFYRTDLPVGVEISSSEATKLDTARAVVVLLGRHGWGPTQRQIARRAKSLQKPLIPVLIAQPPENALEEVDGMFRRLHWADLREPTSDAYDRVADAVKQALGVERVGSSERSGPRYDGIIKTIIDGSEADRFALLDRIQRDGFADRAGLAARLRVSIQTDFSPERERQFAIAVRDTSRLASTRSWMLSLLIWLEPFSPESADLILKHVRLEYEPNRAVRFWTLSGIIQRQLPYLSKAIGDALIDPDPEVSGLAEIVSDPSSAATLQKLRTAISSNTFETAWHVLRILRIVPVPMLAAEVVAQLGRSAETKTLTYDALFALASPEMALAARPIILGQLGMRSFVQLIVNESRNSTPLSITAFARVLSVFDRQEVRSALQESAIDPEDRQIVRDILDDIAEVPLRDSEEDLQIPGHASEKIDITKDDIGIRRDVQTLASVMLARDVDPPLAIGLFGEWGSGKSFYMKSIEAAAADIANRAANEGREQFCSKVVQIHFNAWHYVDTSLWASLVSHMLDGLSAHLAPQQTPAEQRAALARDLASAKAEMGLARAEQELATAHLQKTTEDLQKKIVERERSEVRLRDLRAADLLILLEDDKELNTTLRSALTNVGAPAALESISELNKVIEESYSIAGQAMAVVVSLFKGRSICVGLAGIILFFLAPPLIILGVNAALNSYAANISALIAKAAVAAGSITLVLRLALQKAKSGLDALSKAKRKVDERLAARRLTPSAEEDELQQKITEARANEEAATGRVAAATARAQDIESRVSALEDSQSLGYFIAERSRSEDYRRHLGLISMIRKDFDGLVDRLRATGSNGKGIDRIVLYIDDVDRCPPQMVVDILQAVHLLLAYELFIVVVSVDPRWLLRSLKSRMSQFEQDGSATIGGMGATPQDYLEKIFQIPFTVRPMGQQGFARLMDRLLATSVGQQAEEPPQFEEVNSQKDASTSTAALPSLKALESVDVVAPMSAAHPVMSPDIGSILATTVTTDLDALAEVLAISSAETEFSRRLHILLPTPRSAKRFANIYRLLKASLPRTELRSFEGTLGVPGNFQLPMLLLALLVGRSTLAANLFPQLLMSAREGRPDWWDEGWAIKAFSAEDRHLPEQLNEIMEAPYFPRSRDLVLTWLPQVARYSFNTAKIFVDER